ncbi:MAG: hypothetical protein EPO08_15370 [Rhodospirillaceae bacterium]|nr:MAG: hypothetical protein EPO08_15370 [Rhodospirillaceae bacterium]
MSPLIDSLPGFRRRFIVTPAPDWVRSELEDDFHRMSVTLHHEDGIVTAVEPVLERAPWNTCPGAVAQLVKTFTNVALDAFAVRGEKQANCTHLHDLAVLAAAHFKDPEPLVYDILVADPIDRRRRAELRRNGATVMSWVHMDDRIVEPAELAGLTLFKLRPWIDSLDPKRQEEARLFRWGTMVAHGRTIPLEDQSDASRLPTGACYTFQPHVAPGARRIGQSRDFSTGAAQPLDKRAAVP